MFNDIKTKICSKCGKELPIDQFRLYTFNGHQRFGNKCRMCEEAKRQQKHYDSFLEVYKSDPSMQVQRMFKKIAPWCVLNKSSLGIKGVTRDERFVKLLYYKDSWISSYGRIIQKDNDGEYHLLGGKYCNGELTYTLDYNVYFKTRKEWGYRRKKVRACDLVIQTFIVNYDIKNNICCWHTNNDTKDNYYKHLYPVNEKQYAVILERHKSEGEVSENQIMEIINIPEYKPEGWNPWYFRHSYEGVGYIGGRAELHSEVCLRWQNMIQRCYNKAVHRLKPYYKGIKVCEEWKNFQNFKVWYDEHMIPGASLDLDKDLLGQKQGIYSPETCVLVSHYINTVFEDRGVKECIKKNEDGQYNVSMTFLNKIEKVGIFDTKEEASDAFKKFRRNYIRELAEKSRDKVPDCVYNAMMEWKIEITD